MLIFDLGNKGDVYGALTIHELIKKLSASKSLVKEDRTVVIDFHSIVINEVWGWKAIFIDKNVPLA